MRKIKDLRVLGNIKIGVVGEKTSYELEKYKIVPDFFPKEYTVDSLARETVKFTKEGEKILFVVSDISPVKEEEYTKIYNRKYEKIVVYTTQKLKKEKTEAEKYVNKSDILMFLSSSTFESFAENLGLNEITGGVKNKEEICCSNSKKLEGKVIASIGPVTTKTIEKYGLKVDIEAKRYTEDGILSERLKNNEK